jgi:DNA-directed RNA polymerase III subunit RPC11
MDFTKSERSSAKVTPLDVNAFLNTSSETGFQNKVEVRCEKCGHYEAYFTEVQMRSADEPATLFYCCVSCKHNWREG